MAAIIFMIQATEVAQVALGQATVKRDVYQCGLAFKRFDLAAQIGHQQKLLLRLRGAFTASDKLAGKFADPDSNSFQLRFAH